jgi:hypothetical protein
MRPVSEHRLGNTFPRQSHADSNTVTMEKRVFSMWSTPKTYKEDNWGNPVSWVLLVVGCQLLVEGWQFSWALQGRWEEMALQLVKVASSVDLGKGRWEEMALQLVEGWQFSWALKGTLRRDGTAVSWGLAVQLSSARDAEKRWHCG